MPKFTEEEEKGVKKVLAHDVKTGQALVLDGNWSVAHKKQIWEVSAPV